jgi:hypothetical protein
MAAGADRADPALRRAPPAKPPLDTVSLFALITAVPGLGLVSVPLWGVIRTKNGTRAPGYSETHAHPRTTFQPTVAELWNWRTGVLSHQI